MDLLTPYTSIRDRLVETRSKYLASGFDLQYYKPIPTNFTSFGSLSVVEQEAAVISDMLLLLAGWQGEFVRLSDDINKCKLVIHNSLDPYIRSSIERFEEYIACLVRIRKYATECRKLRSRVASEVLQDVNRKVDDLLKVIVMDDYSKMEHGLNLLYQRVSKIKSILKNYDSLGTEIYEKRLIGGQVLNVLDKLSEKVFENELDNLRQLRDVYWRRFICSVGSWITRGFVDDPYYEFFIWPVQGISAIEVRNMVDNLPDNLKKSDDFVVVPELCPSRVVHLIEPILQCGLERSTQGNAVNWKLLDDYEFSRVVQSLSKSMAEEALRKLKSEKNLDSVIAQVHSIFVLTPCVSWLYDALIKHRLFERSFNSVRKSEKKVLTQAFHREFSEKNPTVLSLTFETAETDVFDALLGTNRNNSSMDKTVVPNFYDMLDISVNTSKLPPIFSSCSLSVFRNIFRLHLCLEVGTKKLGELKKDLPRSGILDMSGRKQLFLLDRLHRHLIDFRVNIVSGVMIAARTFDTDYATMASVYELQELELRFGHDILVSTGLNKAALVNVLQDLLLLIDSYDKTAFENIQEEYFEWKTKLDALQCL